jgi:hypothetical protein
MRSPEVCGGYDDNKRVEGVGMEPNLQPQESVALCKYFKLSGLHHAVA